MEGSSSASRKLASMSWSLDRLGPGGGGGGGVRAETQPGGDEKELTTIRVYMVTMERRREERVRKQGNNIRNKRMGERRDVGISKVEAKKVSGSTITVMIEI